MPALTEDITKAGLQFAVLACGVVALVLTGRAAPKSSQRMSALLASDDGAAYSLNLALLTPLYTLMICFLVELTLMLNVQLGVDYAAYSAARAAIVWLPAEVTPLNTQQQLVDMVHLAAAQAMTPYASSLKDHKRTDSRPDSSGEQAYLAAYNGLAKSGNLQSADYVTAKRRYAMAATSVSYSPPLTTLLNRPATADKLVKVTVNYEMPFNIPGVGRILGKRSTKGPGYVRVLSSTVSLEVERPKSKNGRLGWEYDSRPVGGRHASASASSNETSPEVGGDHNHFQSDSERIRNLVEIIAETEQALESESDPDKTQLLQERLQDANIALELAVSGDSPTANALQQAAEKLQQESGTPNPGKRRYYGFTVTGKLTAGIAEGNATQAYLYDCQTGLFHHYVGAGAAGGYGAFTGFVVKPMVADFLDPREVETFGVEATATAAFFVGGEFSLAVSSDSEFNNANLQGNSGFALGIGAGVSGGDSFLVYRGTRRTLFLRLMQRLFWKNMGCKSPSSF